MAAKKKPQKRRDPSPRSQAKDPASLERKKPTPRKTVYYGKKKTKAPGAVWRGGKNNEPPNTTWRGV